MTELEESAGLRASGLETFPDDAERSTELAPAADSESESTEAYARAGNAETVAAFRNLPLDPPARPGSIGRLAHYEILSLVGRGAMGIVVRAFDTQLNRSVAIKLMSPQLMSSDQAVTRFIREARAAAGINHPNVVTIHSVAEHNGIPFLVMEYVEGRSLMERIRSDTPLTTMDVLRISVQIASGMAAAHRQGIIHRDIKPANIMLEENIDRVKITDFGLARVLQDQSELTSQGVVVGTPAYMSPEQVNGLPLDQRSDLFSLGCVMYAMTTGHSPFRGENPLGTARRITALEHVSLGVVSKSVPAYFVKVVDRLLEKDPGDRYQSAHDIVEELTVHLAKVNRGGDTLEDHPEPSPARRSYRGVALLILLSSFAMIACLFAFKTGDWPEGRGQAAKPGSPRSGPINVSRDGKHDFTSIEAALRMSGPGQEIRVLDSGPYEAPLPPIQGGGLEGLRLVSTSSAILRAPSGQPVLRIDGTPRVVVSGFRIEAAKDQHAIVISGQSSGVRIEDCEVVSPSNSGLGVVYLQGGARGTMDAPIRLKNLRIRGGGVGLVVGGLEDDQPVSFVEVSDCQIRAANRSFGHPVVLQYANRHVSLRRNVFSTGLAALSLEFPGPRTATDVIVAENSFGDVELAFALNKSKPDQAIKISENLIVDAIAIFPASDGTLPFLGWFRGNWWENGEDHDPRLASHFDNPAEPLSFASRDPESSRYLIPSGAQRMAWPGRYPAASRPPGSGKAD